MSWNVAGKEGEIGVILFLALSLLGNLQQLLLW